ncbi:MAG TPA: HEAT repeat domain-containing protein, partial [Planctomycetota bacterium]|nr:HEAT repeat domain-containing protein [Planctomycetota bacterium]
SGALSAMEAPADDVRSTLETLLADATGSERELAVLVALVQRGGVPPDIVERAKRIVSGADDDNEDEVVDVHEIVEAACRVGTERDCIDLRAALIERGILVDLVLGAILEMEDLSGAIGSDLGPALRRFVPRAEALSRARSLYILAQLDESKPEDVETLATLLDHESNEEPEARWLAADALEILGPRATGAAVALGRAVAADPHSDVRWSAAAALGAIGPGARDTVPILVRALDDESMDVVISACRALPRIGHEGRTAIPRLLELLRGDEIERSWRAAYGLGGFGQLADEAVPDLLRFLESENTDARWSAANNLNAIGTRPAEVVPALVAALERETIPQPKLAMIHALASFRPDANIAAKALIARVEDKDEEEQVRLRALEALGALSNPPRAVVNGLAKALGSPEASVRRSALTAIERIGAAAADAVARLRAVLVEEVDAPDLRWRAADALGAIGPAARECVPDLIAAFESPDRDLRWSVVDALANIAVFDSKVKSIIARALEDEDEEVRAAGERAKEAMGGE